MSKFIIESISLRLRSISCIGRHDRSIVRIKLQCATVTTEPSKNLGDHTRQAFDFHTSVHNMAFDIAKIDLLDVKTFGPVHVGRAYLPLRELQKRARAKYDPDINQSQRQSQQHQLQQHQHHYQHHQSKQRSGSFSQSLNLSSVSSHFDAIDFCKKHSDVFEIELPLYKYGTYAKLEPRRRRHSTTDGGCEKLVEHRPFGSLFPSQTGVEIGTITVQATMHFKDQSPDQFLAYARRGSCTGSSSGTVSGKTLSMTYPNDSRDSIASSDSSTLGDSGRMKSYKSDFHSLPLTYSTHGSYAPLANSFSAPIVLQTTPETDLDEQQFLDSIQEARHRPGSFYSALSDDCIGSISPSSGSSSCANATASPIHLSPVPQPWRLSAWDEWHYVDNYADGFVDDGEGQEPAEDVKQCLQEGRPYVFDNNNTPEANQALEEDLMAEIMANGDKDRKRQYLDKIHGAHTKDQLKDGSSRSNSSDKGSKKAKFGLFSEQTWSAFKDIQLMYSSFFGHGWNLGPAEFWRGFKIVEQFYERQSIPTTNIAFDDIDMLERARHFVRLAIASYGSLPWVYFGYSFKVAPLNFIRFNSDRKNVMDYFQLRKEDMVVWHFDKRTALVPSYYIIRDPKYNALCIIIRGTFSITDAMTDLVCEYYPYKGGLVHKGIMDNARFVLERSGKDIEAAIKRFNLRTIYCLGHSLGAGSASLLCSLLQDHFANYIIPATSRTKQQRLEIRAQLFAPPPVCTPDLAEAWEATQTAFINENDLACRLSYGNALDLKELIKVAAHAAVDPAYDGLPQKDKTEQLLRVVAQAQKDICEAQDIPRLVVGGKIVYLHKTCESTLVIPREASFKEGGGGGGRKGGSHGKKKEIRLEYADRAHFTAIPLRANWLWHHFPQQYDSRLERALAWAKGHQAKQDKLRCRQEQPRSSV
ncbi:hypothetical protein CPC16_005816 [Podila verticillata]|nr:hypothetical protein CPC16_005816 [Podila verticillata]